MVRVERGVEASSTSCRRCSLVREATRRGILDNGGRGTDTLRGAGNPSSLRLLSCDGLEGPVEEILNKVKLLMIIIIE